MSELSRHVVRGIVGAVALTLAIVLARVTPWSLALLPVALVAFRGCPTCWVLGLVDRMRGRPSRCGDSGCTIR